MSTDDGRVHENMGERYGAPSCISASPSSPSSRCEADVDKYDSTFTIQREDETPTRKSNTTTTAKLLPSVLEEEERDEKRDEDFQRNETEKKASSSSSSSSLSSSLSTTTLEEDLRQSRRKISELTRANEAVENENSELLIFLENFEKEMENERKKLSQAKEEIKQLTTALESSKESIQILSSERELLSDHLDQISKKLRIANRRAAISKEKEMTLVSRNVEARKLASRIDSLLTDGYLAVTHDSSMSIVNNSKKKKEVTRSPSTKNCITAVHCTTTTLHNKNKNDIGGSTSSSYATMYSTSHPK